MQQGQAVATINAMKIQAALQAERADMVRRVKVTVGDSDAADDVPVELA